MANSERGPQLWTKPTKAFTLESDRQHGDRVVDHRTRITAVRSNKIDDAIRGARDLFVAKEASKTKKVIAYEIEQDRVAYQELAKHRGEEDYQAAQESLNAYTKMQVETHIGERLHVGISKFNFRIKEGELFPENAEESMLSMMKRGRDYRRNHGSPVDWARESAEVYGFEEMQKVLVADETPVGTMMLSISPQGEVKNGSIYKQNFYDVYQKTEDGVVAYRFTSGLTPEESHQKIQNLDERYAGGAVPTDVQFLSRPIRIDPSASTLKTPQEIHEYLHKEHKHMNEKEFALIINMCSGFITSYINTLCRNPYALRDAERSFTVILNAADEIADQMQQKPEEYDVYLRGSVMPTVRPWVPSANEYARLAEKQVREVETGCGLSGSSSLKNESSPRGIYSVAEAAPNREAFECPDCHHRTTARIGNQCPNCNLTKEEFAAREMAEVCD